MGGQPKNNQHHLVGTLTLHTTQQTKFEPSKIMRPKVTFTWSSSDLPLAPPRWGLYQQMWFVESGCHCLYASGHLAETAKFPEALRIGAWWIPGDFSQGRCWTWEMECPNCNFWHFCSSWKLEEITPNWRWTSYLNHNLHAIWLHQILILPVKMGP